MPTTLTLKNVPDHIYERLKMAARAHRRSINSEAILCLETVLAPRRTTTNERLERARELREQLGGGGFSAAEIDDLKRAGRS